MSVDFRNKLSAIIVDDEQMACETLRDMLQNYCPDIDCIEIIQNPKKAIEAINKTSPDILFLDINMPNILGTDLLPIFKANPLWLTIPVIVLSTSNAAADRHKAYQAYVNAYVVKPMDVSVTKGIK